MADKGETMCHFECEEAKSDLRDQFYKDEAGLQAKKSVREENLKFLREHIDDVLIKDVVMNLRVSPQVNHLQGVLTTFHVFCICILNTFIKCILYFKYFPNVFFYLKIPNTKNFFYSVTMIYL